MLRALAPSSMTERTSASAAPTESSPPYCVVLYVMYCIEELVTVNGNKEKKGEEEREEERIKVN